MKPLALCLLIAIALFVSLSIPASSQVVWSKDFGNPHLSSYVYRALVPSVLYDSTVQALRLWFSDGYRVYTAIIAGDSDYYYYEQNPILYASLDFAVDFLYGVRVMTVGSQYSMYYTAAKDGKVSIGLATSADGMTWKRRPESPVLVSGPQGTWDSKLVAYPQILIQNGVYWMWYSGGNETNNAAIGLALSSDGTTWEKFSGNPVLDGPDESQTGVSGAGLMGLSIKDNTFYLLYLSRTGNVADVAYLATSSDGITWWKYPRTPVLTGGSNSWDWDSGALGEGTLDFLNGRFHLWYGAQSLDYYLYPNWQMGHAWSAPTALSVKLDPSTVPQYLGLTQNFPNPFNPTTAIEYEIPLRSKIRLSVFDMLGREIALLVDEEKPAGKHFVAFDGTGLSSGVYFYRIVARNSVLTRRMVMAK